MQNEHVCHGFKGHLNVHTSYGEAQNVESQFNGPEYEIHKSASTDVVMHVQARSNSGVWYTAYILWKSYEYPMKLNMQHI